MSQKRKFLKAFTLIEMLIVMSIFIILFGMSIAAFTGLRSTIILNENSQNLQQDIRYAQRAAILLKRNINERWLYGIGMDFSQVSQTRRYKMFKWCSPFAEFGPARTDAAYPHFDPSIPGGPSSTNGNFPNTLSATVTSCPNTEYIAPNISHIVELKDRTTTSIEQPILIGFNRPNDATRPAYIIFESVSGNAFLYNKDGCLLNHGGCSPVSEEDFTISFVNPNRQTGTRISVGWDSGKVSASTLNATEIAALEFDPDFGSETGGGSDISTSGGGTDISTSGGSAGSDSETSGSGGKDSGSDTGKDAGGNTGFE